MVSGAIPGISSDGAGGAGTAARAGAGPRTPPPRSSFGARLRTRWPQYGHSVTYGLTSEPQFLQTTKSSASLTRARIPPGRAATRSTRTAYAEVFSTISFTTSRRSLLAS